MSKKTRQTVTMIVLCILLIGLGVGYYGLIRYQASQQKKENEAEESEGIEVYALDENSIRKIHFKSEKTNMTVVKTKNTWQKQGEKNFPLNQEKVTSMLDEVSAVTADRLVAENSEDLAQYQLEKPVLTIEIEDTKGNQKTLAIGEESVSGGGRYAYCDDSSKIYILPTTIFSSFDYTESQMMKIAELPEITPDYVTHLEIASQTGKDFEVTYDKKNSPFKDIYSWAISKPYSQQVAGDVDQLQTLFESYSSLSFTECVSYRGSSSELKKYGLDQPKYEVAVDYYKLKKKKKTKKTLCLLIGKQNNDKTAFYVQRRGHKGVYLMEKSAVEAMVKITPLDYVYQKFYVGNEETLQSIDMEYQGKTYHMTLDREKSEKKDEETEHTYTAKMNGKKVDDQKFRKAYAAFSELIINGEIDSKVKPMGQKAVAIITFHEKKKDVRMSFYPYDGNNFYRVEVNGSMQFVTEIRNADNAFKGITELAD